MHQLSRRVVIVIAAVLSLTSAPIVTVDADEDTRDDSGQITCDWAADDTYVYCGPLVLQLPPHDPYWYLNWYRGNHPACEEEIIPLGSARECRMRAYLSAGQTQGEDPTLGPYPYPEPCPDDTCTYFVLGFAHATGGVGPYELRCDPGDNTPSTAIPVVGALCLGHGFVNPLFRTEKVLPGECQPIAETQTGIARDLLTGYEWSAMADAANRWICNDAVPPDNEGFLSRLLGVMT